ncbi:hypothetical protein BJV74DRAFT_748348, partial [Russula compacta]
SDDLDGLPEWAKASWSMSFLPTIYVYLLAAPKPFELYMRGSNLLATVQEVADIVYLGSGYRAKLMDRIFTMRSYFGCEAIKVVKQFFSDDKYAGNRKAISKYVHWATRDNGPGIFRKPAPMNRTEKKGEAGYMKGEDIFESRFIIDVVSPFLKWCKNSSKNFGRPTGALALAAAAVERAFKMYHSGKRKNVGQFSHEKVGDMIDDYM